MRPGLNSEVDAVAGVDVLPRLVQSEGLEALIDLAADAAPVDVLFTATREITKLLGDRGSCIFLDGGAPRVVLAPHAPAVVGRQVDLELYPEVSAAAEGRDMIVIEDARRDTRLASVRALLPGTLGAVAVVPLVVDNRCPGVFLVQSVGVRQVGESARMTAALVSRLAGALLALRSTGEAGILVPMGSSSSSSIGAVADSTCVLRNKRLLVVEDDQATSRALMELLNDEGYAVQTASDGDEGLMRALSTRPDLVLLDVKLPSMDGFDAAALIRRSLELRDVPIIFLSGTKDLSTRIRAMQMDNVDFIPKPFAIDELLARVERGLSEAHMRQTLQSHAAHDELTGLGNLRLFRARMINERAVFARYGSPLSLAMIDVDKLKRINDKHGHLVGSEVLRTIGGVLQRQARATDLPARYGGDEFVVLLPHTNPAEASIFAHRVLEEICRLDIHGDHVTVSIGVASMTQPETADSDDQLLRRADAAAYAAKRNGGNRVCLDEELRSVSLGV